MKLLKSLSSIIALTGCAVAMFLIRWKKFKFFTFVKTLDEKKNNSRDESKLDYCEIPEIPELPNPNWVKIGNVQTLHMYPLNCAERIRYPKLKFTQHGVISNRRGLELRERMFQIYDEQTKELQNEQNLISIDQEGMVMSMNVLSKSKVQFCAPGQYNLTVDLDKETVQNRKILTELKTNGIVIRYIDCGDAAAIWINRYFRSSTFRLVRGEYDIMDETKLDEDFLTEETNAQALELYMTLTRHTVITSNSMTKINYEFSTKYLILQPNIVISAPSFSAYAEENWEWIKIGNIIMRKIMPALSLKRKSIENNEFYKPSFLGIFFGLYTTGVMNVNDDVFIHMKKPENTLNDSSNDTRNAKN